MSALVLALMLSPAGAVLKGPAQVDVAPVWSEKYPRQKVTVEAIKVANNDWQLMLSSEGHSCSVQAPNPAKNYYAARKRGGFAIQIYATRTEPGRMTS